MTELKPELTPEPIAYIGISRSCGLEVLSRWFEQQDTDIYNVQPLYTREQLKTRVLLTKAEFDEFYSIYSCGNFTLFSAIDYLGSNGSEHLFKRLIGSENCAKNQEEFARLWLEFDKDNPEQTVEIIGNKKWFVRSKADYDGYYFFLLQNNDDPMLNYEKSKVPHKEYLSFETKEEAKLWVNPKTEAVLLPIDREDY